MLEIPTQNQFWSASLCQAAALILSLRCHGHLTDYSPRHQNQSTPPVFTSVLNSVSSISWHIHIVELLPSWLPRTAQRRAQVREHRRLACRIHLFFINSRGWMPAQESKHEMKIKKKPFPVLLEHLSLNWYILLKQRCGSGVSAVLCCTVTPAPCSPERSPHRALKHDVMPKRPLQQTEIHSANHSGNFSPFSPEGFKVRAARNLRWLHPPLCTPGAQQLCIFIYINYFLQTDLSDRHGLQNGAPCPCPRPSQLHSGGSCRCSGYTCWAQQTREEEQFPLQQEAVISPGQHSARSKPPLATSSHFTAVLSPAQSTQLPGQAYTEVRQLKAALQEAFPTQHKYLQAHLPIPITPHPRCTPRKLSPHVLTPGLCYHGQCTKSSATATPIPAPHTRQLRISASSAWLPALRQKQHQGEEELVC